jgi:hypothetical protein
MTLTIACYSIDAFALGNREPAQTRNGAQPGRRTTIEAPNAERREMPKCAKCQTARDAIVRAKSGRNRDTARSWRAFWHFAYFGISRRSAFGALWHFALLLSCAVRALRRYCLAPFGPRAVNAVRRSAFRVSLRLTAARSGRAIGSLLAR